MFREDVFALGCSTPGRTPIRERSDEPAAEAIAGGLDGILPVGFRYDSQPLLAVGAGEFREPGKLVITPVLVLEEIHQPGPVAEGHQGIGTGHAHGGVGLHGVRQPGQPLAGIGGKAVRSQLQAARVYMCSGFVAASAFNDSSWASKPGLWGTHGETRELQDAVFKGGVGAGPELAGKFLGGGEVLVPDRGQGQRAGGRPGGIVGRW